MPREPEEDKVRMRVREYLDGALTSTDGRSLSVRAVARFVPCSPTTIYKYGLDKDVKKTAGAIKKGGPTSPVRLAGEGHDKAAQGEAAKWKAKYENVLAKLVLIEYHLRAHPSIDLDEIYATPMPLPDRSEPYKHPQMHTRTSRNRRNQ